MKLNSVLQGTELQAFQEVSKAEGSLNTKNHSQNPTGGYIKRKTQKIKFNKTRTKSFFQNQDLYNTHLNLASNNQEPLPWPKLRMGRHQIAPQYNFVGLFFLLKWKFSVKPKTFGIKLYLLPIIQELQHISI